MKHLTIAFLLSSTVLLAGCSEEPTAVQAPAVVTPTLSPEEQAIEDAIAQLPALQAKAEAVQVTMAEQAAAVQTGIDGYMEGTVTREQYYRDGLPHLKAGCTALDAYAAAAVKDLKAYAWPEAIAPTVDAKIERYKALRWGIEYCVKPEDFESAYQAFMQAPTDDETVYSFADFEVALEEARAELTAQ